MSDDDISKDQDNLLINYKLQGMRTPYGAGRKVDGFRFGTDYVQNRVSSVMNSKKQDIVITNEETEKSK